MRQRLHLAEKMRARHFNDGEFIMQQGDHGDSLFVVEDGTCKVVIEDINGHRREVAQLTRGNYVGEQALLNNAPRNASVVAIGDDCVCLELSRYGFDNSIAEHVVRLLEQVPLLTSLDAGKRAWLAKGMTLKSVKAGDVLVQQGDIGDVFYIIEHGECAVSVYGRGEVARLRRGHYFGELALLSGQTRNATVTAVTDCHVLELGRQDFDRLIGPLAVQGELDVRNILQLPADELLKSALQFAYLRRWDAANEAFRRCHELQPTNPTIPYDLACIAAATGDIESMIDWLSVAIDVGLQLEVVLQDIDAEKTFSLAAGDNPRFKVRCVPSMWSTSGET
jgi:CRP-like cAMP-binding protein